MRTSPVLASILLLGLAFPLLAEDPSKSKDSVLFVSGSALAHVYNSEYDNVYREGEPFFGAHAKARLSFLPFQHTRFSLGLFIRRDFGDESFLSDIRPLFRAKYERKGFSLVVGELVRTANRHGLLDALVREESVYVPAVEEGLQVVFDGKVVEEDLWVSYSALNTAKHREHLGTGNATVLDLGPVRFSLMGYIDHYGGQLFAPVDDPVRENLAGAAGLTFRYGLESWLDEVGAEQFFLGSYTNPDRSTGEHDEGWGSLSRVWVSFFHTMCRFGYYQGRDFVAWEGNPLYMARGPYYNVELSRRWAFPNGVFLDFGGRLEFVEIDISEYGANGEHVMWVQIGWDLDRMLR
jgi:hypothetical protein